MKKLIFFLLLLFPAVIFAQVGQFRIDGKINSATPPKRVYFMCPQPYSLDSVEVVNNSFIFEGEVDDAKGFLIVFKHDWKPLNPNDLGTDICRVIVECGAPPIQLVSPDSVKYAVIHNSQINDDMVEFNKISDIISAESSALYRAASVYEKSSKEYMDKMNARSQAVLSRTKELFGDFLLSHPDSRVSLFAITPFFRGEDWDVAEAKKYFDSLSERVKETTKGREIAAYFASKTTIEIGKPAPGFTLTSSDGKQLSLSDFRGKYLLIDFWASWCGPCRAENPNLIKAYAAFKEKGFEILGISSDIESRRDKWLAAIEKDGLTWPQVSDISAVAAIYGVNQIPYNFLLDPQGKIIAINLFGDKLAEKLSEIFK